MREWLWPILLALGLGIIIAAMAAQLTVIVVDDHKSYTMTCISFRKGVKYCL